MKIKVREIKRTATLNINIDEDELKTLCYGLNDERLKKFLSVEALYLIDKELIPQLKEAIELLKND